MAGRGDFVRLVDALFKLRVDFASLESPSSEERDEFDEKNWTVILHDVEQIEYWVESRPPDPTTRRAVGELLEEIRELYGLNSPPPSPVEPPPQRIMDQLLELIVSDSLVVVDQAKDKLKPWITVDASTYVVTIDGKPYALDGSQSVKERIAKFIEDLLGAAGEYLPRPSNLKTRDIEKQPDEVRNLFESQSGAGTRIPQARIWRN